MRFGCVCAARLCSPPAVGEHPPTVQLHLPPQFGLAWRKGANTSLVDAYDSLLLALQEDGTVSQACGWGLDAL